MQTASTVFLQYVSRGLEHFVMICNGPCGLANGIHRGFGGLLQKAVELLSKKTAIMKQHKKL